MPCKNLNYPALTGPGQRLGGVLRMNGSPCRPPEEEAQSSPLLGVCPPGTPADSRAAGRTSSRAANEPAGLNYWIVASPSATAPARRPPLEPFDGREIETIGSRTAGLEGVGRIERYRQDAPRPDPNAAEPWLHSPRQGAGDSDLSNSVIRLTIWTLYTRLTTRIARGLSMYLVVYLEGKL